MDADQPARAPNVPRELVYQLGTDREELTPERLRVLERIRPRRRVLEVGAATGLFTRMLLSDDHEVTAVEGDVRAVEIARRRGVPAIAGDIELESTWAQIAGTFDAIVLMHVLEHLVDPWAVLARARERLNPDGVVISLLPNVAAWRVRKDLFLHGKFEYTDTGILDRTHLRFFNLASGIALHRDSGFREVRWWPADVCVPLERRLRVGLGLEGMARHWNEFMIRRFPNLCAEIIQFEATA